MSSNQHEMMIRPAAVPARPAALAAARPEGLHQTLYRYLRGRVGWAVALAVLLGAPAAYVGYKTGEQMYTSRGLIRVAPVRDAVLNQMDANGVMPMYDSFVDAQVTFIKSQPVLDLALSSDAWKKLNRGLNDETMREFMDRLKVSRKGEVLFVELSDADPVAAMTGVKAVVDAYRLLYIEQDTKKGERRMEILEQRRIALERELTGLRQQIGKLSQDYGSEDLTPLYMNKLSEVSEYGREVEAIDRTLLGRSGAVATTQPAREMTLLEIAWEDPTMAVLLGKKEELEYMVEQRSKDWGPSNPRMLQLREDLARATEKTDAYAAAFRERQKNRQMAGVQAAVNAGLTDEELKARKQIAQQSREKAKEELLAIGRQRLQIKMLQDEAAGVDARLEETRRRIEQLNVEGALAGRVSVISEGERPLAPTLDTRLSRAGAGGLGGAALGVGLVVLVGFLDRRLRFPEDARGATGAAQELVLGVLPELPHDLEDPEAAALAVRCVHRIRTALQINYQSGGPKAFTITSPIAGTGKTSLALSLGMSFATSGSRTLLIDSDIVGRGLTSRLAASIRRKLGRLLLDRRLVTEAQLNQGLGLAQASNRKLGEVLLELGYVRAEELRSALQVQQETMVGLVDALAGEEVTDCVTNAGVPNLYVLPLGNADARHASTVSPAGLRRVVEASRAHFDVILIDTGPFLGSLEAAAVASVSDGVVLIVSRGEHRLLAEKCMTQLNAVGAHLSGIVFNRARAEDVTAVYSSSLSEDARRTTSVPDQGRAMVGKDIGSIASAVAAASPDDNTQ